MISAGRFCNVCDTFSQRGKVTALTLENDTFPTLMKGRAQFLTGTTSVIS